MTALLCTLPLLASLIPGCAAESPAMTGYVEGEHVLVAPVETARIHSIAVRRGERVAAGSVYAVLQADDARIAVAAARAALRQAESRLDNLRTGKRPQEIAVLEATMRSFEAQRDEAGNAVKRQEALYRRGMTTEAARDDAVTALAVLDARLDEVRANLEVARLPARQDEITAAEAGVEEARAALDSAEWRLSERTLVATRDGTVTDILRNPGEIAGPQAPAFSVLPDGAVKLRFYVPEEKLSAISVGGMLGISCDGCASGLKARIAYVSPEPEFTPPVIYSAGSRQKLVYLLEAVPEGASLGLKPGQIVDAVLQGAGG